MMVSQLSLVDLAGSERSSRTNTSGERLKEASSINKALLVLRNCMETLRDNQVNSANKVRTLCLTLNENQLPKAMGNFCGCGVYPDND